jgi:drug/metabolite transporter (DMT)-like permease
VFKNRPPHLQAVLQALFVTFLWSTSWVLIKIGLEDIPALPFAGLRYTIAFFCLLPFALRSGQLAPLRRLSAGTWVRLLLLGLLFYSITQGAQFVSLFYLPALTVSLMLSFTTVLVALLGIFILHERPAAMQWAGTGFYLAGVLIYFYPLFIPQGELIGLAVAMVGVLANAFSSILGRQVNRSGELAPIAVTVVTMGAGASRRWHCYTGHAPPDPHPLGHHPLAGGRQHRRGLYAVEPHPAHPFGNGVEHHQQHHAHSDRRTGLAVPGRVALLAHGTGHGSGCAGHPPRPGPQAAQDAAA